MKLIYSGPKPVREMQFPIPVLSLANVEGSVKFERGKETEIKQEWGEQVLKAAPEHFTVKKG